MTGWDLAGTDDESATLTNGRIRLHFQPGGDEWMVLVDPEGHLF
jgi:hypothetical protein